MDSYRQENNLHLCIHGEDAPCTKACPFGLDLRDFFEKMQNGRFDTALRLYRNAVVFPDIVWRICPAPCREHCVREGNDAPLSFALMEQACNVHARSADPIAFNLPKKEYRIAIVGAGLSGLTCALKFVPKKYDVTIYEKTGVIGGGLSRYLPEEVYLADIQRQFGKEEYTLLLNTSVDDLDALAYDAIYVSSGVDLPGGGDRVFRCPPDIGPIEMILDGIQSLYEIEWFLKTGNRKPPESAEQKKKSAPAHLRLSMTPMPPVTPSDGLSFTKEEAVAEAARCLRCDCTACMDACAMLSRYKMYPARLMEEVNLTMNPVTLFTGREALRQISSCSQCGLCKQVCPVGVDIGDYFLRTKRELFETDAFPPAFHDFWIRDMAFSNEAAQLLIKPDWMAESRYLFFPGCQLGGSDPRYIENTYHHLLRYLPDTALLLRCCGAPALWAGDANLHEAESAAIRQTWEDLGKPEFLLACPSCSKIFREYLPDIPFRMIYDIFMEYSIAQPSGKGTPVSIFDPCASQNDID